MWSYVASLHHKIQWVLSPSASQKVFFNYWGYEVNRNSLCKAMKFV